MASFDSTVNSLRHRFQQDNQPLPPVTLGAISSDGMSPAKFFYSSHTRPLLILCNPGSFHYAKSFGEQIDNTAGTDDMHWLASATKFITTIAVMQCVERGQLNLNDDIAKVLPEFKDPQILTGFNEKDEAIFKPATKTVTLRQVILLPVSLMLVLFTNIGW